ncbi:MAG: hypothetical protein R3325_16410 [Thermoanaerobaculia bacterium]|nr:hypothetical protein [Thermoanaerobaculia bacterium]
MTTRWSAWMTAAALLALAPAHPARAQEPQEPADGSEITVILERGQRGQLRLALPQPDGMELLTGEVRAAAEELDATLRADLEASGVFVLQGPEQLAALTLTGDPERDYELYRSLGNEILLLAEVRWEEDRLILEGRLYELVNRRNILAKRYRGQLEINRRIAHTFADDLVEFFTGRKGIALTRIAFQTDRQGDGTREVFLMDYDGRNQRPVTAHQTLSMSPDWGDDGTLAYVTYVRRNPGLFLADLASGRKTPLVIDGDFNTSPAFSPDGRKIAFARSVGGGNTEIFVVDRDGSDLRRLTNSRAIDTNPAFSPTGRQIAFTSSRSGSPQIYVMSAEGTDLRRVTFEGSYNDGADWNPEGTRIAHATRRESQFDLALTDLQTLESRVIPLGSGSHEAPSFSPDGRKIAFASRRVQGGESWTQIYVTDLHGGGVRQLTRQGNNLAPAWSGWPE